MSRSTKAGITAVGLPGGDSGLRMLVELGVPIVEAVGAATRTSARVIGRGDISVLRPGAPADLVVLDDDFAVETVLLGGSLVG